MSKTILMPALAAGMEEGTISRWLKAEGDAIASGEAIAEIETDKATMEIEAEEDGVLGKILAVEGSLVQVNTAIAMLLHGSEEPTEETNADDITVSSTSLSQPVNTFSRQEAPATNNPPRPYRTGSSPLARRIAAKHGLSLEGMTGSGPGGRVVRLDVEVATIPSVSSKFDASSKTGASSVPQFDRAHHLIPNTKSH